MTAQKICIVGGGATGGALLWALSQGLDPNLDYDITLIHDGAQVGGHSFTQMIPWNGKTFPVDVGVQFIAPLLYPNVHEMLKRPEFKSRVPLMDYPALKIASGFPRDTNGNVRNWGNFSDYQTGPDFALYDEDMMADANTFENFLEFALLEGWANKTLQEYFDNPPQTYRNKDKFLTYFLAPYLSIINGYGAALMDQTTFADIDPLFLSIPFLKTPLGSFTKPGIGWQRFSKGAQSWVQAMCDLAQNYRSSKILLNTEVRSVWTDPATAKVTVTWKTHPTAVISSGTFDKVILTTDMWTNSKILNNPQNQYYWDNLYKNYVGYGRDINMNPLGQPVIWDLMWGTCFIHTDSSMLSPDLMQQEESSQFTAYYAPEPNGGFDLAKTYTTYIQKNLLLDPAAEGLYLTMYGYIPDPAKGDKVPDPSKVIYHTPWTHGKWTPAFMGGAKANMHTAQGLGNISYPGQMNTNVYFAGNNVTTDSEEGALDSALAMAEYAFGVKYPFSGLESIFMYDVYKNLMFPFQNPSHAISSKLAMLPEVIKKLKKRLAPAKKKPTKKAAAKKTVSKKKTSSTKAAAKKKTVSKKATAKKSTPKKTTKKAAVKKTKTVAKKSTAKKSVAKVKAKTTKRKSPARKSTKR